MTNSKLAKLHIISPNRNHPRKSVIDTITIHCMAGDLTVERCGQLFANPNRSASSNYGIDSDGNIALYVPEEDRSWCTSSAANDNRAVTIEVANDGGAPDWHVSDKAMESLIALVADICARNNIKKLLWENDKKLIGKVDRQNMTVHRWFAAKACPGDYLMSKHPYIAAEVNKRLAGTEPSKLLYRVQVGAFSVRNNAVHLSAELAKKGYGNIIVNAGNLYKVQVGAFTVKSNAERLLRDLRNIGYKGYIREVSR